MPRIILQSDVDSLISQLVGAMARVTSPTTLVSVTSRLFDSATVVFIGGDGPELVAACPAADEEWVRRNLDQLVRALHSDNWYSPDGFFSLEKSLEIDGRRFEDALVVWSTLPPTAPVAPGVMIVLAPAGYEPMYSTYHCWLASVLVAQHDHVAGLAAAVQAAAETKAAAAEARAEREIAMRERKLARMLSRVLGRRVLREEPWEMLVARLDLDDEPEVAFARQAAVVWTACRIRQAKPDDAPDEREAPRTWLRVRNLSGIEDHLRLLDWLLEDGCLVCEAARRTAETDGSLGAATIVAEVAWTRLKEQVVAGFIAADGLAFLQDVLDLTCYLGQKALAGYPGTAHAVLPNGTRLNREMLRAYLFLLVAGSTRLRRFYLGLDGGDGHHSVPAEVSREFLVHLSRYALGTLAVLEESAGIGSEPTPVSRAEVLDSLLYLVDRYVHVELQVDEGLRVREHLARGLVAEVEHHVEKPFYRDHLLHVVDVFLLGHLLLQTRLRWIRGDEQTLCAHFAELPSEDQTTPAEIQRNWAVAALFHDIGYQVCDFVGGERAHDGRVAQFFRLPTRSDIKWLRPDIATAGSAAKWVEELLANLSRVMETPRWIPGYGLSGGDHGVLSALRMAQLLVHSASAGNADGVAKGERLGDYWRALHAIAHHNLFNHPVELDKHPLSCLLRLCDELQDWNRRRVNIEHAAKRLYLEIEEGRANGIDGTECLEHLTANIQVNGYEKGDLEVSLLGDHPVFEFRLRYRNSIVAHFDPTTTLLSKAYNLQHVSLSCEKALHGENLEWRLELAFPRPNEYSGISERDICGLFALRERELPMLTNYPDLGKAPAGLVWLVPDKARPEDVAAVVVAGNASANQRRGWLPCHPEQLFSTFVAFKKELLTGRALSGPVRRRRAGPPPERVD